ncbi:MAG: hypothetical protein OES32_16200 [Acidobacteriota bacterium]|nr:hypothetical protein [Acidobacteriota bacterium]MDH3525119.1 hypothetical protein [Acidobacteriota bacterium]
MSRKYRQRGYRDDESGAAARREPGRPRERREGPRGRGLGSPGATVFRCGQCGRRQELAAVAPDAACAGCGADLHACRQCAHFDPGSPLECRQPIPRRIASKTKRNDCELYEVKRTQEFAAETASPSDAKAAFDDLFDF